MSQASVDVPNPAVQLLAENLLACSEEQLDLWLEQNFTSLSLPLIQYLKDTYVTADQIQADPQLADRVTAYALRVAEAVPQSEMLALAQWARGLWADYNDPAMAVKLYRSALAFYQTTADQLSQARLLSNLVGVLAEQTANQEAEECYQQAFHLLTQNPNRDPTYLLSLEMNFGWHLHGWGRLDEALMAHDRALVLANQYDSMAVPSIQVNRYLTLGRLGQLAESEQGLLQARWLAEQYQQQFTVARIDMNLGELYTILGRPVDALHRFQHAVRGFTAVDTPMEQSVVLALQATLLRQLGAWRVAQTHYQAALAVMERYQLQAIRGETLVNLAGCLRLMGGKKPLQRAVELLNQAQTLWAGSGNRYWLVRVYFEQILVAQGQNKIERARQLLANPPALPANLSLQAEFRLLSADLCAQQPTGAQQAQQVIQNYRAVIDFATAQGNHWLRRQALHGLGNFILPTDWLKGRQLLEAAATTDEQIRQSLSLQELKASFHEQANDLFDELIRGAYQQEEYALVLLYAWRAKASAFLDLAASVRGEITATVEQRKAIAQLRQQIATFRWNLAATAERNLVNERYEAASPELARLEEQLLELRRQTQQHQLSGSTLTIERMTTLLQQMAATTLIEYVRCGEEIYAICATVDGVQAVIRLVNVSTIAELTGQLTLSFRSFQALTPIEREQVMPARINESQKILQRYYELLVAPLQLYLTASQPFSKILIAPCDTLATLPFAAFWTGQNYWIEEQELEFIQSGALLALETVQAAHYSRPLVIAATAGQATSVRQEAAQLLDVLTDSATLIDAPALSYWTGLQAPPRLVHIAAHILQRAEDAPLFTAIQLSGEVLSVEQSYDLPLWGTELVTLSGCTTASGMESESSLFAFQSALLIAGAQRVLCTLWPIADGMAGPLLRHFYQLLQTGLLAPAALRQTQLDLVRQSTSYCHPGLWAAFTCIRR